MKRSLKVCAVKYSTQHQSSELFKTDASLLLLSGDFKFGGFSIDACRSMVALMDVSFLNLFFCHDNLSFFYCQVQSFEVQSKKNLHKHYFIKNKDIKRPQTSIFTS